MAKKVLTVIKLQIPGGQANPAPPVGPALGQHGINIMEFVKAFNAQTANDMGTVIPVVAGGPAGVVTLTADVVSQSAGVINAGTVTIAATSGGATLSGTTTVTAVNGVATFTDLSINKAGAGYTLTVSDGSLAAATSAGFTISPAAASELIIVNQPGAATVGVALSPAVMVAV